MENIITKGKDKTFDTYSQVFEKSLKKTIFKNLIENAREKGILDEIMAREILDDINKMQEYEVASAWYYWGGLFLKVYLKIKIY